MRTLSSNTFGIFNKMIVESKIPQKSKLTGNAIQEQKNCEEEKYYLVEANYTNQKMTKYSLVCLVVYLSTWA
jgi:hypothetical protein